MALFAIGNLNAQQRTPEERAKIETDTVKQKIALTADQATKYQAIALKYAKLQADLRTSIPRDSMQLRMRKMTELTTQKLAEVKPIISAEQFAKYEVWAKENAARRGGRGGGMGGGNRGGGPNGGGGQQ